MLGHFIDGRVADSEGERADGVFVQEALALVNGHEFANGASIFTNDGGAARIFSHDVAAGIVGVNVPVPVPMAFHSFGGWKGVSFYTRPKTTTVRRYKRSAGASIALSTNR